MAEDKKTIISNLNLWHQLIAQFAALNSHLKQNSPFRTKIEAESGSGDAAVAVAREDTE